MEEKRDKNEIFSKRVKAGKRTYFFDVKATKSEDYYLTITESKRVHRGEEVSFEKHKIFLYKEDFAKFIGALEETVEHVKKELMPEVNFDEITQKNSASTDDVDDISW